MESDSSLPTSREIAETFLEGALRSRLVAYARSRFGIDAPDSEDLLQDTALELVRHRIVVHSPEGFVFQVFHKRCCRHLETRRRERQTFTTTESTEAIENRGPAVAEKASQRVVLREVFETISSSCKKILLVYYVEGRSLKETAQAIALPYAGVWNTINRCLRRLRACLDE